jgi:ElaB/YqjD/DUF883 family membrane-anchored ribosome-binding protein
MPTTNSTLNGSRDGFSSDSVRASISKVTGGLSAEFRDLVADIEDFLTATTTLTGEQLEQAKQKVRTRVASAKEVVASASDSALARARRSAEVTNEYVHEQPWMAVGAGVAIGFVAGLLVSRRD